MTDNCAQQGPPDHRTPEEIREWNATWKAGYDAALRDSGHPTLTEARQKLAEAEARATAVEQAALVRDYLLRLNEAERDALDAPSAVKAQERILGEFAAALSARPEAHAASLQRQLDAVDAAIGFPDGTGAGRLEMIKALSGAHVPTQAQVEAEAAQPGGACPNCEAVAQQLLSTHYYHMAKQGPAFLAAAVEFLAADFRRYKSKAEDLENDKAYAEDVLALYATPPQEAPAPGDAPAVTREPICFNDCHDSPDGYCTVYPGRLCAGEPAQETKA